MPENNFDKRGLKSNFNCHSEQSEESYISKNQYFDIFRDSSLHSE
jgi:hypothetical protein